MDIALTYLHLIGVIAIGAALAIKLVYLADTVEIDAVRRLAWADFGFLCAAILVLASGILGLVWFGKPASFYLYNPFFYIKVALFVAIGLISITPTRHLLRWRIEAADAVLPPHEEIVLVRRYALAVLGLFVLIPLCAVLVAHGVGKQG